MRCTDRPEAYNQRQHLLLATLDSGGLMRALQVIVLAVLAASAWLAGGCEPAEVELYRQLQHEDPSVRIAAVIRAGKTKDPMALPYLVDRLGDSEPDVRFFAILALEKVTGKRMGYHYYEPPDARAEAEQRWRRWLERSRAKVPTTQPTGQNPS